MNPPINMMKRKGNDKESIKKSKSRKKETKDICGVCDETFNLTSKFMVVCENHECNFKSCKDCNRKYLLGTLTEPHCMNCKCAWSSLFLITNLNKSYYEKDYKEHRQQLNLERELSKLPETMNDVEMYLKGEECDEEYKRVGKEVAEQREKVNQLLQKQQELYVQSYDYKNGKKIESAARKTFIMPCQFENCRGFLSSGYKCSVCKNHCCPHCLEVIGLKKNDEDQAPHVCNQDSVKSTELIKSSTKPCPSCGQRISKIEGCDQMWCVSCHSAFSWKTGVIDTGTIHNPHYYQYQRHASANGGAAIRNPGDILCGGIPRWFPIRRNIQQIFQLAKIIPEMPESKEKMHLLDQLVTLETIHRIISHISLVDVPETRRIARLQQNFRLQRVLYILNRISSETFSTLIAAEDKKQLKHRELLHIYELLSVVGTETFIRIQDYTYLSIPSTIAFFQSILDEMSVFFDYCNDQLAAISLSYNCKVYSITCVDDGNGFELLHKKTCLRQWQSKKLLTKLNF